MARRAVQRRNAIGGACALIAWCGAARVATADEVRLIGKQTFERVHITGFKNGLLSFTGLSGETLRKPIAQIEVAICDRFPELALGEQAAEAGAWPDAVASLTRAAEHAREPWQADLARFRLVRALDHADEFDRAVKLFIELLIEQPQAAAGLSPRRPGPPGSGQNEIALRTLRAASQVKDPTVAQAARRLILELSIYQDADVINGSAAEPPHGAASPSATTPIEDKGSAVDTANEAPLLFGDAPKRRVPTRAAAARLEKDSWLLNHAGLLLKRGDARTAAGILARAIPSLPREHAAAWHLMLGHARMELGQFAAAAVEFENAARSTQAGERMEALYHRGLSCEKSGQSKTAEDCFRMLLDDNHLTLTMREKASEGLRRVLTGSSRDGTAGPSADQRNGE